MRILIYGGGAIGLYVATRLAKAGNDVVVKVRQKTIAGMANQPVRIMEGGDDPVSYPQIRLTSDLKYAGDIDAAFITTKAWQVEEAARELAPHVPEGAPVVTIQNGVDAPRTAAAEIPHGHVLAGTIVVVAVRYDALTVQLVGKDATLHLGTLDRSDPGEADRRLIDALDAAGLETVWTRDMKTSLWAKLALIASFGGVGAITGAPVGETRATPETHDLVERAAREIMAVANAAGAKMTDADIAATMDVFDHKFADNTTASMQRDLWEGKPSELHDLTGAVVRTGHKLGVPTPINDTIYAAMIVRENRVRAKAVRPVTGQIPIVKTAQ